MVTTLAKIRQHCYRGSLSLTVLMVLSVVAVVVYLILNFWALDRVFLTSDDGWYIYLFATDNKQAASHGHLLINWIPGLNDIFANRLVVYLLKALSGLLFCMGFRRWLSDTIGTVVPLWLVLGLASVSVMYVAPCSTANYTQLVPIITIAGLGILFYALALEIPWLYALAGATLSLLFPAKATAMVLAPVALAIIWIMKGWRQMLYCIVGGVIGLAIWIFIVESPSQIWEWITGTINDLSRSENEDYQSDRLLRWTVSALKHYFKWSFMAFAIIMLYVYINDYTARVNAYVRGLVFVVLAVGVYLYVSLLAYPFIWFVTVVLLIRCLLWTLIIMSCVCLWQQYHSRQLVMGQLLLIFTPMCVSLGTNLPFILQHLQVYVTVLLVASLWLKNPVGRWFRCTIIVVFMLLLGNIFATKQANWQGKQYCELNISLNKVGINQHIKVNEEDFKRVKFYQAHMPEHADVVVSVESFTTAYVLGYNILRHDYRQYFPYVVEEAIKPVLAQGRPAYIMLTTNEYSTTPVSTPGNWRYTLDAISERYDIELIFDDIAGLAKVTEK